MPMRSSTADRIRCLQAEVAFGRLHRNVPQGEIGSAPSSPSAKSGIAEHRFSAYTACGISGAMPNPGLCRIYVKQTYLALS